MADTTIRELHCPRCNRSGVMREAYYDGDSESYKAGGGGDPSCVGCFFRGVLGILFFTVSIGLWSEVGNGGKAFIVGLYTIIILIILYLVFFESGPSSKKPSGVLVCSNCDYEGHSDDYDGEDPTTADYNPQKGDRRGFGLRGYIE